MKLKNFLTIFSVCLIFFSGILFSGSKYGIINKKAPKWQIENWANLTEEKNGKTRIDISDYKGKILYLYGFQSW